MSAQAHARPPAVVDREDLGQVASSDGTRLVLQLLFMRDGTRLLGLRIVAANGAALSVRLGARRVCELIALLGPALDAVYGRSADTVTESKSNGR